MKFVALLVAVAAEDRASAGIIFFCVLGTIVVALALRIYGVIKMLRKKGNVIHWDISGADIEEASEKKQEESHMIPYETSGSCTVEESE